MRAAVSLTRRRGLPLRHGLFVVLAWAVVGCAKSSLPGDAGVDFGPPEERNCPSLEEPAWRTCGSLETFLYSTSPEYPGLFSGCEDYLGSLDFAFDSVEDLSALRSVRSIRGSLNLFNNSDLSTLDGADRLVSVGDLTIRNSSSLTSMRPLQGVRRVTGTLFVDGSRTLRTLEGLSGVECVGELILTDIGGFHHLSGLFRVEGNVSIWSEAPEEEARSFLEQVIVEGSIEVNGEVWQTEGESEMP